MRTVWKYPLGFVSHMREVSSVMVPASAKVLTGAIQDRDVCVWIEVDPDQPKVERMFALVGTGHRLPVGADHYVNTVFVDDLVFHLYELYRTEELGE